VVDLPQGTVSRRNPHHQNEIKAFIVEKMDN
jgi:hypothetical protein